MADDIVYHPTAALKMKIDDLTEAHTAALIALLIEHYATGCDRAHLRFAVEKGVFSIRTSGQDILKVLDWASDKVFVLKDVAQDGDPPEKALPVAANLKEVSDDEAADRFYQLGWEMASAAMALEQSFQNLGETERYPNFPPSWGLDTATWAEIFGTYDPIPAIDFYLGAFFDDDIADPPRTQITLSAHDIIIWRDIIDKLSGIDWNIRIDEPELSGDQKARALRAVLALPEDIGPVPELADPDLHEIIELAPDWLAGRLIDWWSSHDSTEFEAEGVFGQISDQVDVVYRTMVKHLVDWQNLDEEALHAEFSVTRETIADLPDYVPTSASSYERIVNAFWWAISEISDNRWLRHDLTRAIYLARSRVFRDRFPFASDSILVLGELADKDGYWLAHFCGHQKSPEQIFRYLSFLTVPIDDDRWVGRLQLVEKARERHAVYEGALDEMVRDGNLELARAWWAFFMASQAWMFSGFGLGSQESRRIIEIAEGMLPDGRLERAFEFVGVMAEYIDDPLDSRVILGLLPKRQEGGEVVRLSQRPADEFLSDRISETIWNQLHPSTHKDLRDAESLWERVSREMGAGRNDWGGLGMHYARAVEREMKAHLTPLMAELRKAGLLASKELKGIGAFVNGIEKARAGLASRTGSEFGNLGEIVIRLDDAFSGKLRVLTAIRNKAAHGDGADPVVRMEFIELRAAILEHGAFRTIVECGQQTI